MEQQGLIHDRLSNCAADGIRKRRGLWGHTGAWKIYMKGETATGHEETRLQQPVEETFYMFKFLMEDARYGLAGFFKA
eukprot:3234997-Amphidinium_carterae.1